MTALHQYISAIGSFQGVLLFFLLFYDHKTTAASKVLGLYCLVLGLAFFLPFITFDVAYEVFNPLASWFFFLPVLYGSMLYLYCRKVVFNAPFTRVDLIHFLPLLACYLLNADALFYYHEEMRQWIVGASAPTQRLWFSEYLLFGVVIAYLMATALLIKRYHQQASDTLSNFNPAIFHWLSALVLSLISIFLVKGIMAFSNFATSTMLILSDAMIVLIIYFIALRQWKNPQFFVINSKGDEQALSQGSNLSETEGAGAIDESTRAIMFDELTQHIEKEHSYRNNTLSLPTLADAIGISPHHLSEVLNQHAGQNFNHFINAYRVKEVCDQLNSTSTASVLDIALQAGFSSKSTFNTIFKKFMGITPTQYRQKHHA
jgi:AraC-like DNA-binding protein